MIQTVLALGTIGLVLLEATGFIAVVVYLSDTVGIPMPTPFSDLGTWTYWGMRALLSYPYPFLVLLTLSVVIVFFAWSPTNAASRPYLLNLYRNEPKYFGFFSWLTHPGAWTFTRVVPLFLVFIVMMLLQFVLQDGFAFGEECARDALTGKGAVACYSAVQISVRPGVKLSKTIAAANDSKQLSLLWNDDKTVAVAPHTPVFRPGTHRAAVLRREDVNELETVTSLPASLAGTASADTTARVWRIVIITVFGTLFFVLLVNQYLRESGIRASLHPLTTADLADLQIGPIDARGIFKAVKDGRDVTIAVYASDEVRQYLIPRSAFADGIVATSGRFRPGLFARLRARIGTLMRNFLRKRI